MKTIVFVGCHKFGTSNEALMTAKKMGYYTVLLTNKKSHDFLEADKLIYFDDLHDMKACMDALKKLQEERFEICACLSFIEPFVSHSDELAQHFNLNVMSIDSLAIMENKIRLRDKLKNLSTSPFYTIFQKGTSLEHFIQNYKDFLPLVIKPPDATGSKDVILVESVDQLKNGIQLIQKKHPQHPILVEQFLSGPQYLIEVVVYKKAINIIGILAQEFSKEGHFIITGYQFPARLSDNDYTALSEAIQEIIEELQLANGSCHLEMRNVSGEWKLVEINPRMSGGAMNRIIEEGTGINLIEEIINLHVGKAPSLIKTKNQHVYAKYLTISSRGKLLKVSGKDKALKHKGVKYVYVKPLEGKILPHPSTMGHRYACIIAASDSSEEAKSIAIAAAKKIKFYLEPI